MAYVGENPNFKSTILDDKGVSVVPNAPTGKIRVMNRNDSLVVQDDTGAETVIGSPVVEPSNNYFINGSMDFWQRGTSFTGPANVYTADRWKYGLSGTTAVVDVNRSTSTPTVSESGFASQYSLEIDVTTADATVDAGDLSLLRYFMEGQDFANLHEQTVTLSFWIYATKTGTSCVYFQNDAQDRSYVHEFTINSTNTWEKKSVTFALDTVGTWLLDNGIGIQISWTLMSGTTFQGTPNSWQAGDFRGSASQVNHLDNVANVFRITQVKIERSAVVTNFVRSRTTISGEFAACQRYYQTWRPHMFGSIGGPQTSADCAGNFPQEMRSAPSVGQNTVMAITDIFAGVFTQSGTSVTSVATSTEGARLRINLLPALVTGRPYILDNMSDWFTLDAEL